MPGSAYPDHESRSTSRDDRPGDLTASIATGHAQATVRTAPSADAHRLFATSDQSGNHGSPTRVPRHNQYPMTPSGISSATVTTSAHAPAATHLHGPRRTVAGVRAPEPWSRCSDSEPLNRCSVARTATVRITSIRPITAAVPRSSPPRYWT